MSRKQRIIRRLTKLDATLILDLNEADFGNCPKLKGNGQSVRRRSLWNFLQFRLAKTQINVMLALTIRAGTRSFGVAGSI